VERTVAADPLMSEVNLIVLASHNNTGGAESRINEFTKMLITAAAIITENISCDITNHLNLSVLY
jgi:hypothetical protein